MNTVPAQNADFHLGFLRVADVEGGGFVGGILVTNRVGRPLEFQCTTPVRPNRTQAILYGPTLLPFVFSELIGRTLYERMSVKPQVVLVNQDPLLELRTHVPVPVACLVADAAARELPDQTRMQFGRQTVRVHPEHTGDLDELAARIRSVPADADMQEPLDRVQEALQETLRAAAA